MSTVGSLVDDGADLSWGVKSSFRDYITGSIVGGVITTAGAVEVGTDGTFTWDADARQDVAAR